MLINSRKSKQSVANVLLNYYKDNTDKNPATPKIIKRNLKEIVDKYKSEITYYNQTIAEDDAASLKTFYNTNGFHDVSVIYSFFADTVKKANVLRFDIIEGRRYNLKAIIYTGLESLPEKITALLFKDLPIQKGDFFNEELILQNADIIYYRLLNSGYFYTKYDVYPVQIDTNYYFNTPTKNEPTTSAGSILDTNRYGDIVTIVYETGERQRIDKVTYSNDTTGGSGIAKVTKDKFNLIKKGDWYNYENVKQTERNFNTLEVFEKISIDTFEITSKDTLNYRIYTKLRNRNKFDFGLFVNHTPSDGFVNFGFQTRYSFLNPFGAGEELNYYANLSIKDINNIFNSHKLEFEGKFGTIFSQPLLWTINKTQVAFAINVEYSRNNLNGFKVDRWLLPKVSFPVKLPQVQFFNKVQLDISLEGEKPIDTTGFSGDKLNFERNSIFYRILDNYWKSTTQSSIWSAAVIGGSFLSEHRDFQLSPKSGNFSMLSIEAAGLLGIAEYLRLQFTHLQFFSRNLHPNKVHAVKTKVGLIFNDGESKEKYVPFEKQFFCGGANSNRGWIARSLHSSKITPVTNGQAQSDGVINQSDYDLYSNIYGSAGLFELSYEYRYNIKAPNGISRAMANQLSSLGVVAFCDIGNAYSWFFDKDDKPESYSIGNMAKFFVDNLAVSMGFGLRYDTPIGPIRLDFGFPIYGPVFGKPNFILNRYYVLEDVAIHFGIGHSF
jgi:outer membrane protein assembly factor BamA